MQFSYLTFDSRQHFHLILSEALADRMTDTLRGHGSGTSEFGNKIDEMWRQEETAPG